MTVTTVFAGTADGYINSQSTVSFAAARAGSGTFSVDTTSTTLNVAGADDLFGTVEAYESFFSFDTSPVPDAETATAVALSIFGVAGSDIQSAGAVIEVRISNWGVSVTSADWIPGASLSGLTRVATFTGSGWSNSAYNVFTEDGTNFQAAINKVGTTFVMVSTDKLRNNNGPAPNSAISETAVGQSANTTGTTKDPKLVVTSSVVSINYTLTAAQGSFAETGEAATPSTQRRLTAAQGSFAETGQAATPSTQRKLTAAQGSFIETGEVATPSTQRRLTAAQGSFTLTGEDATLRVGHTLVAAQGSFTETGNAAHFSLTRLSANGSFTLTGEAAELDPGLFGRESTGSYVISGQTATLSVGRVLATADGTYTLSGQDAGLSVGHPLTASYGSYAITGEDAVLTVALHLTSAQGAYVLTGEDAGLSRRYVVTADQGSFALTGEPVVLSHAYRLKATRTAFFLDGQDASLSTTAPKQLTADPGVFTLSGQVVAFSLTITTVQYALTTSAGDFTLTGNPAQTRRSTRQGDGGWRSIQLDYHLRVQGGRLELLGHTAEFSLTRKPIPLQRSTPPRRVMLTAGPSSYGVSGPGVRMVQQHLLSVIPGIFSLQGFGLSARYTESPLRRQEQEDLAVLGLL